MSRVNNLLERLVDFIDEEFCQVDQQDCDSCEHYDAGNCPVFLAKQYLEEEGYSDDE